MLDIIVIVILETDEVGHGGLKNVRFCSDVFDEQPLIQLDCLYMSNVP